MVTINLQKMLFYSYHGVHEEEKIVGGDFEVNVTVKYYPKTKIIHHIAETINYVSLYEIVKTRMAKPSQLLETITMEIASEFFEQFLSINEVHISITKLQPPIGGFQGNVGVAFYKKRND